MFESCYFEFNGRSSKEFGLMLCHNGDYQKQYGINRSTITESHQYSRLPYLFNTETKVLAGSFYITSNDVISSQKLNEIAKWLYIDSYADFISGDNMDVVYKLIFTDKHELELFIGGKKLIELSFECNAPWAWSKPLVQSINCLNGGINKVLIEHVGCYKDYNPLEINIYIPQFALSNGKNDYPILNDTGIVYQNMIVNMMDYEVQIYNSRNTTPENAFQLFSSEID